MKIKLLEYLKKMGVLLFLCCVAFMPIISSATDNAPININSGCNAIICNPLGDKNGDLGTFLINLLNQLSKVAALVAVLMIIYSGFQFVIARGNPDAIKKAKSQLFYVIVGTAIVLGADVIINIVVNTISGISS